MSRIYDWLETQNVSSLVAVECGALDFADTRRLAKLFSKVLSFEANPSAKAPADLPANVIVELQALAPTTGVVTFFVDDNPDGNSGASSLLPATPSFLTNYIKKERPVRVSSISLADALAKHGLAAAQFFWLDMEGFELDLLKSVDLTPVQIIYTEVNFQQFRRGGCLHKDLCAFLESKGFVQLQLWTHDPTWAGDVLFAKPNWESVEGV